MVLSLAFSWTTVPDEGFDAIRLHYTRDDPSVDFLMGNRSVEVVRMRAEHKSLSTEWESSKPSRRRAILAATAYLASQRGLAGSLRDEKILALGAPGEGWSVFFGDHHRFVGVIFDKNLTVTDFLLPR